MDKLTIKYVDVSSLIPYVNNAKEHPEEQVRQIANSIEKFGMNDPIAVWTNGDGELEIVEGHGRLLALEMLGIEKCPVVRLDHLSDEERRAYTHIHNQTTLNSGFDFDMLSKEMGELDFDWGEFGFSVDDWGYGEDEDDDYDSGLRDDYSDNIGKVDYEPKESDHKITDLYELDRDDLDELIEKVENEELREMLRLRKAWFTDFKFSKIADYYAYQATPDEQRAFEAMGLILLDRDGLIENGFADIVSEF